MLETHSQGTLLGDVDGVQGGITELQLGEFGHGLGPRSAAPILNIKEARSLIWAALCRVNEKEINVIPYRITGYLKKHVLIYNFS
jgi:hypothetical protein